MRPPRPLASGSRLLGAVLALLLAACAGVPTRDPEAIASPTAGTDAPAPSATTPPTPSPGAAAPGDGTPNCQRFDYPCDLAETPADLVERTTELLAEARQRLDHGTMADALAFLRQQADVVEAFGSDDAIVFRVDGAPEAWLIDESARSAGESAYSTIRLASARSRQADGPPPVHATVVGEDTSADGKVDNRDEKRALILAPFMWQFEEWDESDLLAQQIGQLPGYEGNVRFVANLRQEDQNVTPADYKSLGDYDAIFLSTHGHRACGTTADGQDICYVMISTGIRLSPSDMVVGGLFRGFIPIEIFHADAESTHLIKLGITHDFFRMNFPDGLDDTLLVLSACETGNYEGNVLAAAAAGDNFVMMAWSETVPSPAAFKATGLFAERLALGLSSWEAYGAVVEAGLHTAVDEDGIPTVFQFISPGGDDVRLIELPTVYRDGEPMTDGMNISDSIIGLAGDDEPDRLELDLRLSGIDSPAIYSIRYDIDGKPARGSYDLADARPADVEFAYFVEHEIDIGFDLLREGFTIEAIVDLPEGGESRYFVSSTLCPTTENDVPVPFDLPPDAAYLGAANFPPRADAWRVGNLQAAADFMRVAIEEAGYTIIDEPRGSFVGDDSEFFGLTVVGPCLPNGGSVAFSRGPEMPPTMLIWSSGQ